MVGEPLLVLGCLGLLMCTVTDVLAAPILYISFGRFFFHFPVFEIRATIYRSLDQYTQTLTLTLSLYHAPAATPRWPARALPPALPAPLTRLRCPSRCACLPLPLLWASHAFPHWSAAALRHRRRKRGWRRRR